MKKVFSNKEMAYPIHMGFSLIELIIASLILLSISTAVMRGVVYYRNNLRKIQIEERAYEELKGYTNYWKSKIGTGEWISSEVNWVRGPSVDLGKGKADNSNITSGELFYKASEDMSDGDHPYPFFNLNTRIIWKVFGEANKKDTLEFFVKQIVY